MSGLPETVLAELVGALGEDAVVTDPDILAAHSHDRASFCAAGVPAVLLRPRITDEVQRVMRIAHRHRVPVILRPPGVHPHEHLGPVLRLRAARTRVDRQQRIPGIVRAPKHVAELDPLDLLPQRLDFRLPLGLERRIGVHGEQVRQLPELGHLGRCPVPWLDPAL